LRRNEDDQIALNDRLARERVTRLQIARRESQRRTPPDVARFDHHRAASTAPLPAARDIDVNPRLARGVNHQCAVPRLDRFISWLEVDFLRND
jgi:hypothetical protein